MFINIKSRDENYFLQTNIILSSQDLEIIQQPLVALKPHYPLLYQHVEFFWIFYKVLTDLDD